MRELTLTELELVSGGNNSDVTEVDEIVVIGDRGDGGGDWGDWGDWGDYGDYGDYGDGGGGAQGDADDGSTPPPDEASIDVTVNIERPLTAEEEAAINKLKEIRTEITNKINSIPNNEFITLADGSKVSGAELKQLWSKTDFIINEIGTEYDNKTTRGEADFNGGDPKISFNIDILKGYADSPGGVTYAALHELGHITGAGQNHNNSGSPINEQVANDIARAIAHELGMVILSNPLGGGYSTTTPLLFNEPSTSGGGGGGGGGGNQQQH